MVAILGCESRRQAGSVKADRISIIVIVTIVIIAIIVIIFTNVTIFPNDSDRR